MKHDNRKRNRLIACLMCAVLAGVTLFGIPWFSVQADDTTTGTIVSAGQSYGAWSDEMVKNGSFEVGYKGREVYGWHKTAMTAGNAKEERAAESESYCRAYTLTTAIENDNKVAALTKDGAGYIAATSDEISVSGGQDYIVSFDYKTVNAEEKDGGEITTSNYFGIRLYVEELKENGTVVNREISNQATTHYYEDKSCNSNWSTGVVQFETMEDTTSVVLYLYTGATAAVSATVYFDNVTMEALGESMTFDGVIKASNEYEVFNGTFDKVNYTGTDGRTAVSEMGPAGWRKHRQETNYKITTVDGVACLELVNFGATSDAEVFYYSPLIPIDDITATCQLTAECKVNMKTTDGEGLTLTNPIYTRVSCVDEDQNFISGGHNGGGKLQPATSSEWTKVSQSVTTLKDTTKYVRVGVWVKLTSAEIAKLSEFKLYFDNFALNVGEKSLGYTKITAGDYGKLRASGDYTDYFGIRRIDGGSGYEDAVQLYVTQVNSAGNPLGGAAFYSQLFDVTSNTRYKIAFDYKIEGITNSNTSYTHGADVFLRYWVLNEETGEYEYYNTTNPGAADEVRLNTNNYENTDGWISSASSFTIPENVVKAQVGLLMSLQTQSNPDMKYSFANICVEKNDSSWWSTTGAKRANTDLIFKLTERGNAYNSDTDVDVLDLVMMKKYAADATLITDENKDTVLGVADMNVNTLINNADIELLHWKLLGITTEDEAAQVQGYDFYQQNKR